MFAYEQTINYIIHIKVRKFANFNIFISKYIYILHTYHFTNFNINSIIRHSIKINQQREKVSKFWHGSIDGIVKTKNIERWQGNRERDT